ncbi:MAG: membrane protein insertion efficiency factor YidD [Cellvibrionales bacterium]|nr:membrane protein insertion efficiency factor YidD [Cellvibrionales bacterium]
MLFLNGVLLFIWIYQRLISPYLGSHCRFYPSCSSYTKEALITHGLLHGGWLGLRRISRCHPFSEGGVDLVPQKRKNHG